MEREVSPPLLSPHLQQNSYSSRRDWVDWVGPFPLACKMFLSVLPESECHIYAACSCERSLEWDADEDGIFLLVFLGFPNGFLYVMFGISIERDEGVETVRVADSWTISAKTSSYLNTP